jgi:hypothetical protein
MASPVHRIPRPAAVLGLLAVALGLLEGPAAAQTTSPSPPGTPTITATGTAAGQLAVGSTIDVRLRVTDTGGWQRIDTIHISLELHGAPLDLIEIVPTAFSIAIVGSAAPPATIGDKGVVKGTYIRVDNGKASVAAQADRYTLTFPMRIALDPPPGARLVLSAQDTIGISSDDVALTPPVVKQNQGFPWGTIGLAVAAALFIGGFVGNMFSTRRAKARPNVYATVARRLDEERSKR